MVNFTNALDTDEFVSYSHFPINSLARVLTASVSCFCACTAPIANTCLTNLQRFGHCTSKREKQKSHICGACSLCARYRERLACAVIFFNLAYSATLSLVLWQGLGLQARNCSSTMEKRVLRAPFRTGTTPQPQLGTIIWCSQMILTNQHLLAWLKICFSGWNKHLTLDCGDTFGVYRRKWEWSISHITTP